MSRYRILLSMPECSLKHHWMNKIGNGWKVNQPLIPITHTNTIIHPIHTAPFGFLQTVLEKIERISILIIKSERNFTKCKKRLESEATAHPLVKLHGAFNILNGRLLILILFQELFSKT